MGGGLVLGIAGAAAGDTNGAVAAGVGGLALLAGLGWYIFDRPTLHIFRLLGRVRVSVNALPIVPGGTAFQTIGEGQTELLIDPSADEGFELQ
jgi:hypothetical protein